MTVKLHYFKFSFIFSLRYILLHTYKILLCLSAWEHYAAAAVWIEASYSQLTCRGLIAIITFQFNKEMYILTMCSFILFIFRT